MRPHLRLVARQRGRHFAVVAQIGPVLARLAPITAPAEGLFRPCLSILGAVVAGMGTRL